MMQLLEVAQHPGFLYGFPYASTVRLSDSRMCRRSCLLCRVVHVCFIGY